MAKTLVPLIAFFSLCLGSSRGSCPKFISCETSEERNSCPEGTVYRENAKVHGCCPGCVETSKLKGEGEKCRVRAECQPGLTCQGKCEKDPSQACEYYKRFDEIWRKTRYWKPDCLPDGTYAPKQCKGEKMAGKCFCVDAAGERIFGEEEWSRADNMTCGCSRLVEELRKRGRRPGLHCDPLGDFEPLQCDGGVCWCASPATGLPYAQALPPEMMTSLPCHDRAAVGAQYRRRCDSARHVGGLAESLLSNHGTAGIALPFLECNFDGSFHRVRIVKEKHRCVFVDDSPLTEAVPEKGNCNCAYDRHVALLNQVDFFADCLPRGDYKRRQVWNGKAYCVDRDGFFYSDDADVDCPPSESSSFAPRDVFARGRRRR